MKVNGKQQAVPAGTTLGEFLDQSGFDRTRVAVERNGAIVPKAAFDEIVLQQEDSLEVVSFVGGG